MLVALCASHIDSDERLKALHRMLDSVSAQTYPIELHISISGVDSVVTQDLRNKYKWLHVYHRQEHLAQFEHYKLLSEEVLAEWCMFTDDDDVWHERRVEKYLASIKETQNDVVACVAGRMHNGRMLDEPIEYFEFAAKLAMFCQFFSRARPELLKLRGCDLIWRNVMRSLPCTLFITNTWLYKQETPQERMNELLTYLDDAKKGWETYIADNGIDPYDMVRCWESSGLAMSCTT